MRCESQRTFMGHRYRMMDSTRATPCEKTRRNGDEPSFRLATQTQVGGGHGHRDRDDTHEQHFVVAADPGGAVTQTYDDVGRGGQACGVAADRPEVFV